MNLINNSLSLVDAHQRLHVVILVVLLLCQALLDVISVASMAPLALLIIQPSVLLHSTALLTFYQIFDFHDIHDFSIALLCFLVTFLIIKHFLTRWIGNYKIKLAFSVSGDLAHNVIRNFLRLPYTMYAELRSSQELNRVINLPTVFAHNILLPMTSLFTEGCILLLVTTMLLIYTPWATLFLGVVLLPAFAFYHWNQNKIKSINDIIKTRYPLVLEKFLSLYENMVEIKLYQREEYFSGKIGAINQEVLSAQSIRNKLLFNSTRLVETMASLCLCLLIGYFIFSRASAETSIPLISLFAAGAVRAIPAFNRMFIAHLEIKSSVFVVEELRKYQHDQKLPKTEKITFFQKVELIGIHFGFPGNRPLLQNLSLTFKKGEKIALTGKSGSGKTTLLMILMRFLKEDQGVLLVDGRALTEEHVASWRKHIAYVPQNAIILDTSILENITFGREAGERDLEKIKSLLNSLGLAPWVSGLPDGLTTRLGEKGIKISGGQRQRLAIARALYTPADVLLLDEITNQLDTETEVDVINSILNLSDDTKTIIMITHQKNLWGRFDSVYQVNEGKAEKLK